MILTDDFGTTRALTDAEAQLYFREFGGEPQETSNSTRKTYRQLLNPWSGLTPNGGHIVLKAYVHMAEAFTSPGLLYALLVATIVLGSYPYSPCPLIVNTSRYLMNHYSMQVVLLASRLPTTRFYK
jgi:hypothetical protein